MHVWLNNYLISLPLYVRVCLSNKIKNYFIYLFFFSFLGSNTIQSFSERLSELDQIVRRMILESLDLEKYLEEHMGSTNYLLGSWNIKGLKPVRLSLDWPHTQDKNIVTILYQNQVEGLEVETKDGEWINVEPSPDSFTVMIGDSLLVKLLFLHY